MYRLEIIANKSVEEDITDALEQYIPGILYSVVPLVYGRGGNDRKLGTSTWPETNFLMISYIEDKDLPTAKAVIEAVKDRFKGEGIKMFIIKSE